MNYRIKILMKNVLINILNIIINFLNKFINKLNITSPLTITSFNYNESGRFLIYHVTNNNLQSHRKILNAIYLTLMNNKTFIDF
jgi:hypothetical protein